MQVTFTDTHHVDGTVRETLHVQEGVPMANASPIYAILEHMPVGTVVTVVAPYEGGDYVRTWTKL